MVRRWVVGIAVMAALAGCTSGGKQPGGASLDQQLHQRARSLLDQYDQAVVVDYLDRPFVPLGSPAGQIGDWEPANADNDMRASAAGFVSTDAGLPRAPIKPGLVFWRDGVSRPVPLYDAGTALGPLTGRALCTGCQPLVITDAQLTTLPVQTTRGPATAPGWVYTLEGTSVRLTRLAVNTSALVMIVPPTRSTDDLALGNQIETAAAAATTSRQLVVTFDGFALPKSQPCGADYSTEAIESAYAIVVPIFEHEYRTGQMCPQTAGLRTALVDLGQPLSERAVLDVNEGHPVPVTISS